MDAVTAQMSRCYPRAPGRHKAGRGSLILKVPILQCEPAFLPWNHLGSTPEGHIQNLLLSHCNSSTQNPFQKQPQEMSSGFSNPKDELHSSSPKNALGRGGRQEQEPNHQPNTVKYIYKMMNLKI